MENLEYVLVFVLVLVVLGILWFLQIYLSVVKRKGFNAGTKTTMLAARTACFNFFKNTQKDFKRISDKQRGFQRMPPFSVRLKPVCKSEEHPFEYYKIECRGLIPVWRTRNINFVASLLDITESESKPVMSVVDDFQEKNTIAFQLKVDGGLIEPFQGFSEWVTMGAVIPEIIIPPRSGIRLIKVIVRIVDRKMTSKIHLGFGSANDASIITTAVTELEHRFSIQGYEEAEEDNDKACVLTVKLAVAMAMADGDMDDSEGEVIKCWIIKQLSALEGERREEVKHACNEALREAYADGVDGKLSVSSIVQEFSSIDNDSARYNAVELCLDVMAANGEADPEELLMVKHLSVSLGLDFEEIQKMKDKRMVSIDVTMSGEATPEELLGIEEDWTSDQINSHLRKEFAKWNGRLNHLDDPEERANAQKMIDLISEIRKKYAA